MCVSNSRLVLALLLIGLEIGGRKYKPITKRDDGKPKQTRIYTFDTQMKDALSVVMQNQSKRKLLSTL